MEILIRDEFNPKEAFFSEQKVYTRSQSVFDEIATQIYHRQLSKIRATQIIYFIQVLICLPDKKESVFHLSLRLAFKLNSHREECEIHLTQGFF